MYQKDNASLQIDLVFKCNDFSNLSDPFLYQPGNLIFESSFWEEVLLCWINIILSEKNTSFPNFIFDKKIFSLSLQIINNNEISSINQKWMDKSGPTDVLSFPMISDEDTTKNLNFIELGDLFISLEMAFQQSLEFDHSIKKEMLWLASHGFLHLLGWEHNDDNELDNMLNFQEYLISKLD
ncbi:rRNA maturation RNase YbeY [Prochlorococcus marinus]|uniref:Endoribonuclease YbeY n=1 Tax=Prochlorococcus marinus (strain MIT 9515) TaxID=167542 RepID=YBEY_PROM5|nr:rRNA maturation RNase YbeY [Prochlorococcus marinus]A2BUF9.2 RecName: Full=Endoribonuclease YbeY [Prochlorococcus marinus str. MIT 9515]